MWIILSRHSWHGICSRQCRRIENDHTVCWRNPVIVVGEWITHKVRGVSSEVRATSSVAEFVRHHNRAERCSEGSGQDDEAGLTRGVVTRTASHRLIFPFAPFDFLHQYH